MNYEKQTFTAFPKEGSYPTFTNCTFVNVQFEYEQTKYAEFNSCKFCNCSGEIHGTVKNSMFVGKLEGGHSMEIHASSAGENTLATPVELFNSDLDSWRTIVYLNKDGELKSPILDSTIHVELKRGLLPSIYGCYQGISMRGTTATAMPIIMALRECMEKEKEKDDECECFIQAWEKLAKDQLEHFSQCWLGVWNQGTRALIINLINSPKPGDFKQVFTKAEADIWN